MNAFPTIPQLLPAIVVGMAGILGGSIAKELERPDSDIDAAIIVSNQYYLNLKKENRLAECIFGHCTYENGYFDV